MSTFPLSSSLTTPAIHTARLILRPLAPSDLTSVYAIRSDPLTMKWTSTRKVASLSETEQWMTQFLPTANEPQRKNYNFGVVEKGKNEGKVIGLLGIVRIDRYPEVGYMFHQNVWGRGYATEALTGFLDAWWALPCSEKIGGEEAETESEGIWAIAAEENTGSSKVLKKCGFKFLKEEIEEDGVKVFIYICRRPEKR
ncbi:MAG: hypothetical protein M1834_007301 [Cirrosporium novae-zelandiae]|nr:MAG: hypothetical protein M1834_007301 [Cirrosporium novae-zelandiae]